MRAFGRCDDGAVGESVIAVGRQLRHPEVFRMKPVAGVEIVGGDDRDDDEEIVVVRSCHGTEDEAAHSGFLLTMSAGAAGPVACFGTAVQSRGVIAPRLGAVGERPVPHSYTLSRYL